MHFINAVTFCVKWNQNERRQYTMPTDRVPFSLRIPEELLLRLKKLADFNKRSANREAENILEQYISRWEAERRPE